MIPISIVTPTPSEARLVQVGGRDLVADYGDAAAEARAVAGGAGLIDRSAWGRVQLTGRDRLDFLQRMSTNDFDALADGAARATVFTDARGRMIDRTLAYGRAEDVLLVGGLGTGERLVSWLRGYIFFRDKVKLADVTATTAMLTLYGPRAADMVRAVLGVAPSAEGHVTVTDAEGEALVGGADPLHGGGVNVIAAPDVVARLWPRLTAAGATPMGYTAYEALRIEAGWPAVGHEITDDYNPLEAGLLGAVCFTKGCYIGQEVVARLDTYQKLKQHLMGLRFEGDLEIAPGAALEQEGRRIGVVTSVAAGAGAAVGLGYVRAATAHDGAAIDVVTPDGRAAARLVALPGRWKRPYGMVAGPDDE